MSETQKLISVDFDDIGYFESVCHDHGVEYRQEPNRGDPATVAIFLIMGAAFAVAAIQDAVDRHKGGQVIDLRRDAEKPFYRSKDLAYGLLYVQANDGTVSLRLLPGASSLDQLTKTILAMRGQLSDLPKDEAVKQISDIVGGAIESS